MKEGEEGGRGHVEISQKKKLGGAADRKVRGMLLVRVVALVMKVLSDLIYQGLATLELGINMVSNLFRRATNQGLGASKLLCLRLVG